MDKVFLVLKKVTEKIESTPEPSAQLYATRAHIYSEKLEKYQEALNDLDIACGLPYEKGRKGDHICFHNRARLLRKVLRKNELARKDYNKAIEIYPNAMSLTSRGTLLQSSPFNDINAAIKDFTWAIELDSKCIQAYRYRGILFLNNMKEYDKALKDFDVILRSYPKDDVIMIMKGLALRDGFNDMDGAFKYFTEATKVNRRSWKSYFFRGDLFFRHYKKFKLALQEYDRTLIVNPNHILGYIHRAELYQSDHFKDYAKAVQDYSRAIEMSSTRDQILHIQALEKREKVIQKIKRMKKGEVKKCMNPQCSIEAKRKCVVCKMASYCSRECQKIDWLSHKKNCQDWRKRSRVRKTRSMNRFMN